MSIEVERKFALDENTLECIQNLGGQLTKEDFFTDVYFDDSNYSLTRSDYWLRKRNGIWQLKSKSCEDSDNIPGSNLSSKYQETEDTELILNFVSRILGCEDCPSLESLTTEYKCEPFAEFSTRRKKFKMADGVGIDLDETDYGHRIGEIEVMVEDNSDIPDALRRIEKTASDLGK